MCAVLWSVVSFGFLNTKAVSVYYGTPTSNYPATGYMIVDMGEGQAGACGINFISSTTAVTAAHCLDGVYGVYANVGEFNNDYQITAPAVETFNISPEYNEEAFSMSPGIGDVGVVIFSEAISVSKYGSIASPSEGCNYYLVGYGENETQGYFSRTGTGVCIKNITEYSFELDFDGNSHFCVGDSGSAIYEEGTNKMVGLVSAFYTPLESTSCVDGVAFIAARLDYNDNYLKQYLPSSAFEGVMEEDVETVPNDYFGDSHPETQNDDGTFNYNDEILLEIEKLGDTFDGIFPEENAMPDGTNTGETGNSTTKDESDSTDDWLCGDVNLDDNYTIDGIGRFNLPSLVLLCVGCCGTLIVAVVILMLVVKNGKKRRGSVATPRVSGSSAPAPQVVYPSTAPQSASVPTAVPVGQMLNTVPAVQNTQIPSLTTTVQEISQPQRNPTPAQ